MSRSERGIDRIVDEAKAHFGPESHGADHDWSDLDRRLFARLASGAPAAPAPRASKLAVASGLVLAAAAALTLSLRTPPSARSEAQTELAASAPSGQGLRIVGPSGAVRLGGAIRVGDRLEAGSVDVGFTSLSESGARAVDWRLERDSQLLVTRARLPLGLALERGAVEADVAKVPSGEAFVVDVGPVRVAVRGTHLRVARAGDRVSVDLTEGTIAIGAVPREGLTQGTLVSAPAHVEIDLAHPEQISVDRKHSVVRAPTFDSEVRGPVMHKPPVAPPPHASAPQAPLPALPAPSSPNGAPSVAPAANATTPAELVAQAVRACVDRHVTSTAVHVTVTTALVIDVGADGGVQMARFEPPLAPEVQACAAETIYKTRFPSSGTQRITIVAER